MLLTELQDANGAACTRVCQVIKEMRQIDCVKLLKRVPKLNRCKL